MNIYLLLGEKGVIGVWLMNIRGTLAIIVGLMQSVIAALIFVFACCLYFNFFGVEGRLNGAVESFHFHVLVLLFFGFFSIISGLFLVYEWLESR
jgi:hypothetical protein